MTEPSDTTTAAAHSGADQPDRYSVLVHVPDLKTALRLTPCDRLTRHRVHAAILTRQRAEAIAAQITADVQTPA